MIGTGSLAHKGSIHERLAWGIKKSEMENQQRKKNKSKNREMER